jgi:hypothetical protein
MARFERPIENLETQDSFGDTEVGFIHPIESQFVKLNDAGDMMFVVSDSLAIIMHKATNSMTFVADSIRFITKEGDSIRWNNNNFNSRATDFTQPALTPLQVDDMNSVYDGSVSYYTLEEDE